MKQKWRLRVGNELLGRTLGINGVKLDCYYHYNYKCQQQLL